MDLAGAGPGAEGAARRHAHRYVPGAHAHQVEVVGRGHAQHEAILQGHAHATAEAGAVPGEDHAHSRGGALSQEILDLGDQFAAVLGLVDGGEGVPAVDQDHEVGQALIGRGGGALLGQGGVALQGEGLLAAGGLGPQHVQQAADAVGLVAGDHGPGVGQGHQRAQGARAGV